ncbi:MAG: hypothetical protein IH892_16115, partial [Planctomycetes bacterium]|nr:hypothetical protein [Planctomycetota bacterium]
AHLVLIALLLLLFGCTKKEDDSHLESNAASELNTQAQAEDSVQSNVDDPYVKSMLELWEAGQKEDAVKEFLAIRWEDPSAYREVPVFAMSDRQWRSLPRSEQLAVTKDSISQLSELRKMLFEVVATGRTLVSSGDAEMAKEHFEAALRFGEGLSRPRWFELVRDLGRAASEYAQKELTGME